VHRAAVLYCILIRYHLTGVVVDCQLSNILDPSDRSMADHQRNLEVLSGTREHAVRLVKRDSDAVTLGLLSGSSDLADGSEE
jgi:hypothetical protein